MAKLRRPDVCARGAHRTCFSLSLWLGSKSSWRDREKRENLVLFVVLINLLKGETLAKSWDLVLLVSCFSVEQSYTSQHLCNQHCCSTEKQLTKRTKSQDFARVSPRPVVSVLMYTVIPVDRRVVFGSACGVIWGVYLSLYAGV
jgi:protein Mpv17